MFLGPYLFGNMNNGRLTAFYSTVHGQRVLMRESMGQDYPGLDTPLVHRAKAGSAPSAGIRPGEHPLVGRTIRATWRVGRLREVHEGVVMKVDPVATSSSLRLVLSLPRGNSIRCYTEDRTWTIEMLAAA